MYVLYFITAMCQKILAEDFYFFTSTLGFYYIKINLYKFIGNASSFNELMQAPVKQTIFSPFVNCGKYLYFQESMPDNEVM